MLHHRSASILVADRQLLGGEQRDDAAALVGDDHLFLDARVLGLMTRYAAVLMILFVIVATRISHRFWPLQGAERRTQAVQFAKNAAIIGGFLFVFATGAGRASLDRWWRRVE